MVTLFQNHVISLIRASHYCMLIVCHLNLDAQVLQNKASYRHGDKYTQVKNDNNNNKDETLASLTI